MPDPSKRLVTEAFERYGRSVAELLGLVLFVGRLIVQADQVARTAAEALLPDAQTDEERERYEQTLREDKATHKEMQEQFAQLFTRMTFVGGVDAFLTYIVELITLIYSTRPEALKSAETVKVEDVLRYPTLEELIGFLVERKVDRLAYQSMRDLSSELERSLGFPLVEREGDLRQVVRIVETRNIIVHNRAIVNSKFLRHVSGSKHAEGDEVKLVASGLFADFRFLQTLALTIDEAAAAKFGLLREAVEVPPEEDLLTSDETTTDDSST